MDDAFPSREDAWYERSLVLSWSLSIWQTKLVSAYFLKTGILCCQKFATNSKGCQNVAEQLITEATQDSKNLFSFTCGWTKLKGVFFSFNSTFMCTGEDLDDSNTLRTGRVFLKAKKKSLFSKIPGYVWSLWIKVYEFSLYFVLHD